jgi:poly(3-hydroxybutyrate) depolymerase
MLQLDAQNSVLFLPNKNISSFVRLSVMLVLLAYSAAPATAQTESIPRGQIVERVEALNDSSQSYALYVPANYTPDRKWPVLYAFDPGARGRVPVERFKEAAEKYGWIVAGSNNSRNGPWTVSVNAWNAMQTYTHQRFAIDEERMYATGFSGGARAAVRIAIACKCLAGVLANGAGFPVDLAPSPQMHFVFFGAAGVDDFNYPELRNLEEPLTKAGISHRIQTFDGRHEWPPVSVATAAVEWMELHAIKAGKRPLDDGFINTMWQQLLSDAKTLEEAKKYYETYQLYLSMAESFNGLRDVAQIETKVKQLSDSREVKAAIRDEQAQIRKQRDLEGQLNSLMAGAPVNQSEEGFDPNNHLQAILSDLRKQSSTPDDSTQRRVARRVLDGLFIGLIEQGISLLQTEKNYSESIKRLKLATEVNPDRSGAFFYLAWAYAANRDKKKSLQFLSKAVEKGFSDAAMITANKAFDSIRNDPEYQQIMARLRKQ